MEVDYSFLNQYSDKSGKEDKEESEETEKVICRVDDCDFEVYEDCEEQLCYHHHMNYCERGWATPTYIAIRECELSTCDNSFEQKTHNQKYCELHRRDGDKFLETQRVAWRDWEEPTRKCPCGNEVPKGRWRYCSEECYRHYRSKIDYENDKELVKNEYDLSDEELEVVSQFAIELSYLKSSNYPLFIESIKEMRKEEGLRFTRMVTELVSLSKEEEDKLGL